MNIIEAVSSDTLIKRKNWLIWIKPKSHAFVWEDSKGRERIFDIIPEDVLATDWEIKE